MEQNTNTKSSEFDFNQIKSSLNTSMEEDGISVSQELINKTMDNIREQNNSVSETTSNGKWRKSKFNFTNITAAVLMILIVGTVVGKNIYNRSLSPDSATLDSHGAYEIAENDAAADGDMDTNGTEQFKGNSLDSSTDMDIVSGREDGKGYDEAHVDKELEEENHREEAIVEDLKDALIFSTVVDIDISDIESIEVSYYVDESVVNKDITSQMENIFTLLDSYPLEEVLGNDEKEWMYKLNVISVDNNIYKILIGDNLTIIKDKQTAVSDTNDISNEVKQSFNIEEIEGLKVKLNEIMK